MSQPRPKVLVLGVDGADWGMLEPLIEEGVLPHLSGLRARSAYGDMTCTVPAHTAPGWASLLTACYPGKHGAYQFFSTQHPSYAAQIATSDALGPSTLFDWFGAEGWRCGVVNVPMTHPPRRMSASYQITWPLSNTLRFSDPPSLLGEMANAGAHFKSDLACMFRGDFAYIDEALQNIEARTRSIRYLLSTRPVDLFMVVVTELDRVGHHYWHFADRAHPAYAASEERYSAAIRRTCIAIDALLGAMIEAVPEASLLVVSDHGMGPGHDDLSLNLWLEQAGYLAARKPEGAPNAAIAPWFRDDTAEVDWEHTRAFCPVPGSFAVNVNLRGRQCGGTVAAVDFARTCQEITDGLLELRHPRTGLPAISRVLRGEECHMGPFVSTSPDLVVIPRDEATFLGSAISGPLWRPSYQTGIHRHRGLWMQCAPHTAAGRITAPLRIVDVAPTMMRAFDLEPPTSVDGAAIDLSRGIEPSVSMCAPDDFQQLETVVTERLRAMGYL